MHTYIVRSTSPVCFFKTQNKKQTPANAATSFSLLTISLMARRKKMAAVAYLLHTFSKVRALVHVLCKGTIERTFQKMAAVAYLPQCVAHIFSEFSALVHSLCKGTTEPQKCTFEKLCLQRYWMQPMLLSTWFRIWGEGCGIQRDITAMTHQQIKKKKEKGERHYKGTRKGTHKGTRKGTHQGAVGPRGHRRQELVALCEVVLEERQVGLEQHGVLELVLLHRLGAPRESRF